MQDPRVQPRAIPDKLPAAAPAPGTKLPFREAVLNFVKEHGDAPPAQTDPKPSPSTEAASQGAKSTNPPDDQAKSSTWNNPDLANKLEEAFKKPPKSPNQAKPAANGKSEEAKVAETDQGQDDGPSIESMLGEEVEAPKAAPKAKEEIAATPDEQDPLTPEPKGLQPRASEQWKASNEQKARYRAEKNAAEAKAAQLEARLKELEASKPQVPEDYSVVKAKAEEFEKTIKELSVERHPEFKQYYAKREAEVETTLKNGLPADKATAILKAVKIQDQEVRDEKLSKLTEGMTAMQAATVSLALDKWGTIQAEKAEQIGKSNEALAVYEAREEAKRQELATGTNKFSQQSIAAAKALASKTPAFQEIAGDEAHNAAVRKANQFVQDFHNGKLKPDTFAAIPVVVQQAAYLSRTVIPRLNQQLAEAKAVIARMGGASPKTDGTGRSSAQSSGQKSEARVGGFRNAVNAALRGEVDVPMRR
jgi:hypothetical protein